MSYQGMRAQAQDQPYYQNTSLFPGTTLAHTIQCPSGQCTVRGTQQVMAIPSSCFEMNPGLLF